MILHIKIKNSFGWGILCHWNQSCFLLGENIWSWTSEKTDNENTKICKCHKRLLNQNLPKWIFFFTCSSHFFTIGFLSLTPQKNRRTCSCQRTHLLPIHLSPKSTFAGISFRVIEANMIKSCYQWTSFNLHHLHMFDILVDQALLATKTFKNISQNIHVTGHIGNPKLAILEIQSCDQNL